jgi:hypothetical protein
MKKITLPQVIVILAGIFLLATVLPSLLDAKSDISVFVAVVIVVSLFYGIVIHGRKILKAFGFEQNDSEEKE